MLVSWLPDFSFEALPQCLYYSPDLIFNLGIG
jgi:hypothetical protein